MSDEQKQPPKNNIQLDEVALADKNVEISTFDRYKARKGQKDLISILSSTLLRGWTHFYNSKTFRCISVPGQKKICCVTAGPPAQKFGLVLFQYLTDDQGNLADTQKCQGKIKVWVISESRYEELSGIHKRFPLMDAGLQNKQHDIVVSCTEEQYQRLQMIPAAECHWKSKQTWYTALKEKEAIAKEKLKNALGKQLTETEVMEIMGASVASQTGGAEKAGDIDLSDIIDS